MADLTDAELDALEAMFYSDNYDLPADWERRLIAEVRRWRKLGELPAHVMHSSPSWEALLAQSDGPTYFLESETGKVSARYPE